VHKSYQVACAGTSSLLLIFSFFFSSRITLYFSFLLQDESDEMLSRGFKDQIYDVYRYLPQDLQVLLAFSVILFGMEFLQFEFFSPITTLLSRLHKV